MKFRARWVLTFLRFALCAGAIVFLVMNVPWHDYVHLDDADRTRVRLVESLGDELVIQRWGASDLETIPASAVHQVQIGERTTPDVELGIPSVVLQTDRWIAFLAVLMFMPVPLMSAFRLVWMLAVQRVRLSLWNSVKLTFAGNFFNFALPGMTGGDLFKAYYITRFTHKKTEAVTTVFLDRVVGLASLVFMAGAMILFTADPSRFADLIWPILLIVVGLLGGAVVVYSRRIRRALHLRQLMELLPMSEQLERIGDATLAMRRHKGLVLASLLITLVLQSMCIISAIIMARALGMDGSFSFYFIYIAIGFLISAVPISPPQAFGVMEFFYVLFFTQGGLNNSASQAVALALAVRLIQLVWSLPGVLVPLLGAHLPHRAELEALEAEAASGAAGSAAAEHPRGVAADEPATSLAPATQTDPGSAARPAAQRP